MIFHSLLEVEPGIFATTKIIDGIYLKEKLDNFSALP